MIWVITGVFAVLSILFFTGKGSFLIAGYNTASKEQKKRYDEKKLCRLMGVSMGIIAVSCALQTWDTAPPLVSHGRGNPDFGGCGSDHLPGQQPAGKTKTKSGRVGQKLRQAGLRQNRALSEMGNLRLCSHSGYPCRPHALYRRY